MEIDVGSGSQSFIDLKMPSRRAASWPPMRLGNMRELGAHHLIDQ